MSARRALAWVWLSVLLPAVALAAPAKAKNAGGGFTIRPARTQTILRTPGLGVITSVTAQRAFVDRGSEDGITEGMKLQLTRGTRGGAVCEVEWVGPHVATCRPGAIRVGDRFTIDRRGAATVVKAPTAPVGPDALAPQLEALADSDLPLHDFVGGKAFSNAGVVAEVGIFHTSIAALNSPDAAFHQERADVAVYGAGILGGLSFGADATALIWSKRPTEFRSPHTASAQLQVRELWAGWSFKNGLSVALGRLTPRKAPGAGAVDGAQVGWASPEGGLAVGAYGGSIPSPVTLTPLGGPFTAGAFVVGRLGGENVKSVLFEPSLRLAWVGRAGANRFESQALLKLWWGVNFNARLEAAAGFGDGSTPNKLDAVRFDVGGRVANVLRLRAAARYSGGGDGWLGAAPILPSQSMHGDAYASAELPAGFTLSAQGGAVYDFATRLTQGRAGPELELPPFLGGALAFALGYDEEFGWMPGRSGYVQAVVRPLPRVGIWARASVFHRTFAPNVEGLSSLDGALSLSIDARIYKWFWVRGTGWARAGFAPSAVPAALAGQLGVGATF